MDRFTFAERATDWRGNNIAESMFSQMARERFPIPRWIVVGAGTGGTSATIGRDVRSVVDRIIVVRDVESVAAMVALSARLGRRVGPSTGRRSGPRPPRRGVPGAGERGSLLTLICDGGERYLGTYHDPAWVASELGDVVEPSRRLAELFGD
jgi:cysteine synthase A